jgi:limonene-1,2-epoxide hydrolase
MSAPTTPAEIVDAFIAAIEAKDLDTALALVSDDCEYDNVPMMKVFGRDAIGGLLGPMVERCTEVEWIVNRQAAEGNLVFNERLDRFHMGGKWVEIAVTGVWEITDGRISLWRDYFDLKTYTDQV